MILPLSPEQAQIAESLAQPGFVLIGRIIREPYNGANVETSGRWSVELGAVPEAALPALRDAISRAKEAPSRMRAQSSLPATAQPAARL
jgi:hypothetical protein